MQNVLACHTLSCPNIVLNISCCNKISNEIIHLVKKDFSPKGIIVTEKQRLGVDTVFPVSWTHFLGLWTQDL